MEQDSGLPTSIGSMRWVVLLAQRQLAPIGESNLAQQIIPIARVHAAIKPVSLQTFIDGEQVDFGVTHRIFIRWQPFASLSSFNIVIRDTILPNGSTRHEVFQIRRASEWQGRHRFVCLDVEMQVAEDQ